MTGRTEVFQPTQVANDGGFTPRDWGLFVALSMIWGASFLFMAEALEGFTPGMVTLGRVGLGAVTLWSIRARTDPGLRIDRVDLGRVVLLGLLWVAIPFTLFPIAQQWINSAVAGLLNGATPVLVAVVSAVFVRVLPPPRQVAGLVIGFTGIALISLGSADQGPSQLRGVLLILAATTCYGFAFNIAPPLQARYPATVLMSTMLTVATVACAPLALVNLGDNAPTGAAVAAIVAAGALGTGIAYWLMGSLVARVGPIRSSFITYLIPVVALGLGAWLRADAITTLALIGTPLSIVGAILASRRGD